MRNAVLALCSCMLACVGELSGRILVTWELRAPDGTAVGCLPGEEVHVVAQAHRFIYDCDLGGATTGPVPTGTYDASIELYLSDGPPIFVSRTVTVLRGATADAGAVLFTVPSPAPASTGSATFVWTLHQGSAAAPPEGCQPGETVYLEVSGLSPFTVDCYAYDSQPITDLAPGRYTAYAALAFNGVIEDDPRAGYGNTEVSVTFDVAAAQDTSVPLDFIVSAAATRSNRTKASLPAPKISAWRRIK
jgi:hypothetical protein